MLLCFLVPVPLLTLPQLPNHLKLFVVAVCKVLELAYTATEKDGRRIDGCYPADQRPIEVILEDILVELQEMGRDINALFIAVGAPSPCLSCFQ
jgi:hypothetical protein